MYTFNVSKMSCSGCASNITQAVKNEDKYATVEFDLPAKIVKVESERSEQDITSAISNAGYPAFAVSN
jgi:copper chaperone